MGDRNNPIKFGPEWLRNLARERSAASSRSNSQNPGAMAAAGGGGGGGGGGSSQPVPGPSSGNPAPNHTSTNPRNNPQNAPKVQLAKLRHNNPNHARQARGNPRQVSTRPTRQEMGRRWRYGREEMLALYDRNTEAPSELRNIDLLYQPRSKPPTALATFEEETRDNVRNVPPPTSAPHGERFGVGRGLGRGLGPTDSRGARARGYMRQMAMNRNPNWNAGGPRMPMYSGAPEDESGASLRIWNNSNVIPNNRNGGEQAEWQPNKIFRRRPGANTNWRQSSRDDSEEWRSDTACARPSRHQDRWGERDWGDRPVHHHPSWNTNRRTWVGGDGQNNEENLPEWAVENAEACGGTFDSSGAFHGYSNDDSNLPKPPESAYALARSQTHGGVVRQKPAEEGSEEWWASEKAKKLSPKRFDAGDIKFKKTPATSSAEAGPSTSANKEHEKKYDLQEIPEKLDRNDEQCEGAVGGEVDAYKEIQQTNFLESKTFDALMRPNINMNESGDERSNFQSVMIAPNNSLRQKHQNMGPPVLEPLNNQSHMPAMLRMAGVPLGDIMPDKSRNSLEDKLVEQMFDMALEDKDILPKIPTPPNNHMMNQVHPSSSAMSAAISPNIYSRAPPMPNQMPMGMAGNMHGNHGMPMNQNNRPMMPAPGMQSIGITNSALNASLGLPLGGPNMGMPLQGVPRPILPATSGMQNPGLGNNSMPGNMSNAMQAAAAAFQTNPGMAAMSAASVGNNSLYMRANNNNVSYPFQQMPPNEMPMPNQGGQPNMYPMHGLQHQGAQGGFGNLMYGNMMQSAARPPSAAYNLADQWYYEDPKNIIQGPFLSKEMYHWYRAGFFTPELMVRRACDTMMRSLSSYGPIVPFAQLDIMPFPMPNNSHENMLHSPQSLALDIMNMPNLNLPDNAALDGLQFGSVGMRNPPFGQNQMGESMWGQAASSTDMIWMQHPLNPRNENRANHPMYFWDQQPTTSASNTLLPEVMPKEMKTEDQILAQLRATQNIGPPPTVSFFPDPPSLPLPTPKPDDGLAPNATATPNLEELHKLIQKDSLVVNPLVRETSESSEQIKPEKPAKMEMNTVATPAKQQLVVAKAAEPKAAKQAKNEPEKPPKVKETNHGKTKNKKPKEEKKDEVVEVKAKEKEEVTVEKRSSETSPSKNKKEDKANKKDIEKEKKEWIKDGFTVVKGSEKNAAKENKKRLEEAKAAEEAERKKKADEKAAEEEKKRKQAETIKKIQDQQDQVYQQRQATEYIMKKAPWSASSQTMLATTKDGLTLAEIQRLEREKKLEQMKEQQHMMQIIAQQQAVALAREQEMHAGLGWTKKKATHMNSSGQTMAEIQAEARRQAVAASVLPTPPMSDYLRCLPSVPTEEPSWGTPHNGGGFWDAPQIPSPPRPERHHEVTKTPELNKTKKRAPPVHTPAVVKKEASPAAEFENWCTLVLSSWSSKIDVPTFIAFLKDIESPFEVKDYVKCYLGESKETADIARQFLEKRSKLLRVNMPTPSDDLCSPAMAINPRPPPSTEYQEAKGKGKKSKKNKMLKVDARILGFSVTASEDRINVGDIDMA